MTTDVTISCPHCRRQYTMKVDPERLQRLKMRATCGRCGNSFDVGSRIAAPSAAVPKPDLATLKRIPAPAPPPVLLPATTPTVPDLVDEMAELAREFADAAARFTPVGVRPMSHAMTIETAPVVMPSPTVETPAVTPAGEPVELPPPPLEPAQPAQPAAEATPPMEAPQSLPLTISFTADDASDEFEGESVTSARKNPKSWIDLADPGLAAFKTPPDAAAAALEALLSD